MFPIQLAHAGFSMSSDTLSDSLTTQPAAEAGRIYCVAHCYGAPLPDHRSPSLSLLTLDSSGKELTLVQQVTLPEGTLMPLSQVINRTATRLYTTAGTHGIACYELNPADGGKILEPPVCFAVTPEPLPTPYGVMPVDIALDKTEEKLFVCNFLAGTLSELTLNAEGQAVGSPKICSLEHPGLPEKVRRLGPSAAAQELGFPEGFPEDASHPHGVACHPKGKWMVACDLGTSCLSVFALPLGHSFQTGKPDFVLKAHRAPESNRHYSAGTRLIQFSPCGNWLFSVNELDHTVSSYHFEETTGKLAATGAPQMTVPQDWLDQVPPRPYMYNAQPNYNSGLAVSPDGRHVYCSARGHDSIAGFSINSNGSLTPTRQRWTPSGGRTPWSLAFLNDEYLLVTNQNADDPDARRPCGPGSDPDRLAPLGREPGNLLVMQRDASDGTLRPTGVRWEAPHVISVQVAPSSNQS